MRATHHHGREDASSHQRQNGSLPSRSHQQARHKWPPGPTRTARAPGRDGGARNGDNRLRDGQGAAAAVTWKTATDEATRTQREDVASHYRSAASTRLAWKRRGPCPSTARAGASVARRKEKMHVRVRSIKKGSQQQRAEHVVVSKSRHQRMKASGVVAIDAPLLSR